MSVTIGLVKDKSISFNIYDKSDPLLASSPLSMKCRILLYIATHAMHNIRSCRLKSLIILNL